MFFTLFCKTAILRRRKLLVRKFFDGREGVPIKPVFAFQMIDFK